MKIIFTLFLVQGDLFKLDITVHKANVLTYIWSFPENLEISENLFYDEKIAFWKQIRTKIIFTLFLVQGGLLKLDIMVRKANVLTCI